MSKKIFIFDLDGTLLDTLQDLTISTNYVLNYYDYPQKSILEVKNYMGNGVNKLIERAIPDGKNNPNFLKCIDLFKEHYAKNLYNNTIPYDGIIPMLKNLKSRNLKLAVASNKFDYAVKELCSKYFGSLIDVAVGENEKAGINKKPSPDMIINILKYYNYSFQDAYYVGDSEVDIQTAKNANVDCISACWGFKSADFLKVNGANIIINSPNEMTSFIE